MSSAASTAFCAVPLDGPRGLRLWFDGNGKLTAGNGSLDAPQPNAFSLAHIEDCPGSTAACRAACYVHGLRQHAPDTYALYEHNSAEIRRILADKKSALEWAWAVGNWSNKNCAGGFRWHVSGDVFSAAYADWITDVCDWSPTVQHWIYTRSFDHVRALSNTANLAVNISSDDDNMALARSVASENDARLCHIAQPGKPMPSLHDDDVIFPDYALRGSTDAGRAWFDALPPRQKRMVCPVDYHGKSENRRCGPCARCLSPRQVA